MDYNHLFINVNKCGYFKAIYYEKSLDFVKTLIVINSRYNIIQNYRNDKRLEKPNINLDLNVDIKRDTFRVSQLN